MVEQAEDDQLEYRYPEGDAPVVVSADDGQRYGSDPVTPNIDQSCPEGESHTPLVEEPPIAEQVEAIVLTESEIELSLGVDSKPHPDVESAPSDERGDSPISESADVVVLEDSELEIKLDKEEIPEQIGSDKVIN